MTLAFLLLIAAAVALQVWPRLSPKRRAAIVSKANAMLKQAHNYLQSRFNRRSTAYKIALMDGRGDLNPAGQIIVSHLARFCYAFSTTAAKVDRDEILIREGRRQVFIELQRMLALEPKAVFAAIQQEDALAA